MDILVLLTIFIAAMGLFAVAMFFYMNYLTRVMVHRDAELLAQILVDRQVPRAWSKKYRLKIVKLQSQSADTRKIEKVCERARSSYQRQLRRIISYAQGTPLLSDEEKRSALVTLREVSEQWKRGDIENA